MVLDVDVPKKGVQLGKFLQVRIRFDATKKLIEGKGSQLRVERADGFSSNTSSFPTSVVSVGC